nr:hypothetical protein [Faecalibaculum rodentium]
MRRDIRNSMAAFIEFDERIVEGIDEILSTPSTFGLSKLSMTVQTQGHGGAYPHPQHLTSVHALTHQQKTPRTHMV